VAHCYQWWLTRWEELTGFQETRAETHPETQQYCNGALRLLRLSQEPWLPDGFPETWLSRDPTETLSESTGC